MFQPMRLVNDLGGPKPFKKLLADTNRRLARAKLPPLHLNAMVWNANDADKLKAAGYASTTSYNIVTGEGISSNRTLPYENVISAHQKSWAQLAAAALPYSPTVTVGWDVTARCEKSVPWPFPPSPLTGNRDYPYGHLVVGNTPDRFKRLCQAARDHCQKAHPTPNAVFINAWNEWTEGSFLLPEKRYGQAYLEAIRDVFKK
jgi:hypothetical protein